MSSAIFGKTPIKFATQEIIHNAVRITNHEIMKHHVRLVNTAMVIIACELDNETVLVVYYNRIKNTYTCMHSHILDAVTYAAVVPFRLARNVSFMLAEEGFYHADSKL